MVDLEALISRSETRIGRTIPRRHHRYPTMGAASAASSNKPSQRWKDHGPEFKPDAWGMGACLSAVADGAAELGLAQEEAAHGGGHVGLHGHGGAQDNVQALDRLLREILSSSSPASGLGFRDLNVK